MKTFTEHFSAICLNFAVWSKHLSQRRQYAVGAIPQRGLGAALGFKSQIHTTSQSTWPPYFKAQTHSLLLCSSYYCLLQNDFGSTRSHHIPHPSHNLMHHRHARSNILKHKISGKQQQLWPDVGEQTPLTLSASLFFSSIHPLHQFLSLCILSSSHKGKCYRTQGRLS